MSGPERSGADEARAGATALPAAPGSEPAADPAHAARRFLDRDGRLKVWPSKLKDQKLALAWLATHFEPGRRYHEREVNELLKGLHTFGDWALLRRALFDHRYLEREADGSAYWRA
jgi:hypothetical protein